MILSVIHTPNGNLIELRVEDGVYTTNRYELAEDGTREIGAVEAREWQQAVRAAKQVDAEIEAVNLVDVR
jgi:hypothetical protein